MGSARLVDRRVGAAQHNPPLAQFDGLHPSYFLDEHTSLTFAGQLVILREA